MNEIIEKENISIENMIYEIRGMEVMLDSDLAKLYQVETKRINEAVKNNPLKFSERFSWLLTNEELKNLRSKISTLEIKGQGKYTKYVPRVFTEQGVYMLATILKSKVATNVSIAIMDTFVKMRHYINYNKYILPHRFMLLEDKVDNNTKRIDELVKKGCQFIIATHSPILISYRNGIILDLNNNFEEIDYKDTEIYSLYKMYLDNPEEMQNRLFDDN